MTQQLPYWVVLTQSLGTVAIALLAVVIALGQWRTARNKLVLDLFDRRMALFEAVRKPVARALVLGLEGNNGREVTDEFERAVDPAPFLFGHDVVGYLKDTRTLLIRMNERESLIPNETRADTRDEMIRSTTKDRARLAKFQTDFPELLMPYLGMNQKAPAPTWPLAGICRKLTLSGKCGDR